jgi:single-strand DNA-binding protein
MLNRIILIGRLTRDPELRYTPQGTPVATLGLAVERPGTDKGSGRQTDFIDAVCWRQPAEFAANYLSKGRLVAVEGRLQVREWVGQDGVKRRAAEVVADNLQALDRPESRDDGGSDDPFADS